MGVTKSFPGQSGGKRGSGSSVFSRGVEGEDGVDESIGVEVFGDDRLAKASWELRSLGEVKGTGEFWVGGVWGEVGERSEIPLAWLAPGMGWNTTVSAGFPSIFSISLDSFKVIRRADFDGTVICLPPRAKVKAFVELDGELNKIIFLPLEFKP